MAAGSTPSGANQQPWRFVAIADPALKRRVRLAAEEERKAREEDTADQQRQPGAPPPRLDLYLRLAQLQAPVPTVDLLA